jgi:hypothetical protein
VLQNPGNGGKKPRNKELKKESSTSISSQSQDANAQAMADVAQKYRSKLKVLTRENATLVVRESVRVI